MQLFEENTIGTMTIKNRFIRSALWMKAANHGHITPELQQTYDALAEGGVGLILTGYIHICADEKPNPGMLSIADDSFIPELRKFTDRIHQRGSKVVAQIVYGGSQSHHPEAKQMKIIAPSAVENIVTGLHPKEASKEQIIEIEQMFAQAAQRAKEAGFDGVQLHAAHGYFLSMFLTPYYNRREDEYNGGIHDRARIIYETFAEVRKQVGLDFPVMVKMNHDDFMDDGEGLTQEDSIEVFARLDELGADMLEVSGANESSGKGMAPARTKIARPEAQCYFREATEKIAARVKAPVVLMGGNRNVKMMTEILNSTDIRLFSIARPLLCEPDLINRWGVDMGYRPKCVSCNRCWQTTPNSCVLNRGE